MVDMDLSSADSNSVNDATPHISPRDPNPDPDELPSLEDEALLARSPTLGTGAFGTVHKVQSRRGAYALKVVRSAASSGVAQVLLDRARQEVAIFEHLQRKAGGCHPAIICALRTHLVLRRNGDAEMYYLLGYDPGTDLAVVVAGTRSLRPPQLYAAAADMAEGLAFLHSQGVLHRDVKPANLYVTEGGQGRLLDLGAAVRLAPGETSSRGDMVGSRDYMPPSALEDGWSWTHSADTDAWALGRSLAEAAPADAWLHEEVVQPLQAPGGGEALQRVCTRLRQRASSQQQQQQQQQGGHRGQRRQLRTTTRRSLPSRRRRVRRPATRSRVR